MALQHPNFDPNIFSIGPINATWYGFMYSLGFIIAYVMALHFAKSSKDWNAKQVDNLLTYSMIGVIVGGRLGYVLFYGLSFWKADILYPLKIYQGGMSFHGGLIGVILACLYFARKEGKTFLQVSDFIAPLVPVGLGLGRLGNFINGELWGRVTDLPWGMIFPRAPDLLPRHPSQLYEAIWEGLLLFIVLNIYRKRAKKVGQVSGLFLVFYGVGRFFIEFCRQPDAQLGFVGLHWLTMGQLLCLPMIVIGLYWLLKGENHAHLS